MAAMGIDFLGAHKLIRDRLTSQNSLKADMDSVISFCEAGSPHPDWNKFRDLPDELPRLKKWLKRVLINEPPMVRVAGIWFGLFNPVYGGAPVADLYVAGSTHFVDDGSNDWAVDPDYWPDLRYARSSTLRGIYEIAYSPNGLGNDAEYPLCLAFAAFAVKRLASNLNPSLILPADDSAGVAVGFDSGDSLTIGTLTNDGFVVKKE